MSIARAAAVAAALVVVMTPGQAEVARLSDAGFSVGRTETLAAGPAEVWSRLIRPAEWWSGEHSWSGDAANLTLDPRAGGCFCEALPGGGSVEHMRVIHVAPGALLRMTGTLGPLQAESLTGVLSVELAPVEEGTNLTWTYKVSGSSDIPLGPLAPVVDGVIGEQFARLAAGLR